MWHRGKYSKAFVFMHLLLYEVPACQRTIPQLFEIKMSTVINSVADPDDF
jgi:hypothetical protein